MAQELSLVGEGSYKAQLPAHLQARFGDAPSNIITDSRIATLGIRGKVFSVTVGGETQRLQRPDQDTGDMVPVAVLPVIILDYAIKQGRSYYDSAFDPDVQAQPTCWSLDGVVPEPEVAEKQSLKCASCQWAVKGSKVSDNNKSVMACSLHRILSVVPARNLDLPPLQLRIAQTSDYDGQNPELKAKGYFAFKQFLEALKSRGVPSTRAIITNLSFDQGAAFPKLLFRANNWITPEMDEKVQAIMEAGKVREMLTWTGTEASMAGEGVRPEVDPSTVTLRGRQGADSQDSRMSEAEDALGEVVAPPERAAPAAAPAPEKAKPGSKASTAKAAPQTDGIDFSKLPKAAAPAPAPAPVKAEFTFRDQEEGEDEDDYNIAKAAARKAFRQAQAAPAKPAEFVPPAREVDEDEDDYAVRVATARKAWKKANGGAPSPAQARPQVTAEEVPADQQKPASAFGGPAGMVMDLGGDDEPQPAAAAAPAAGKPRAARGGGKAGAAKEPPAAVPAKDVPSDVESILGNWGEGA